MNKIKDILYNKSDILIAILILAIAALIIFWRLGVILEYPKEVIGTNDTDNVLTDPTEEDSTDQGEAGDQEQGESTDTETDCCGEKSDYNNQPQPVKQIRQQIH